MTLVLCREIQSQNLFAQCNNNCSVSISNKEISTDCHYFEKRYVQKYIMISIEYHLKTRLLALK